MLLLCVFIKFINFISVRVLVINCALFVYKRRIYKQWTRTNHFKNRIVGGLGYRYQWKTKQKNPVRSELSVDVAKQWTGTNPFKTRIVGGLVWRTQHKRSLKELRYWLHLTKEISVCVYVCVCARVCMCIYVCARVYVTVTLTFTKCPRHSHGN